MTADLNQLPPDRLFDHLIDREHLNRLIASAKHEDLGSIGDITTRLCIPHSAEADGLIHARSAGVLSGGILLSAIAEAYNPALRVGVDRADGSPLEAGERIARMAGSLRDILAAERVMLNFLTHLSGIATLTSRYAEAVAGTGAKIFDTRKTLPGLRALAKYAVRCGGGFCHRIGLHDAVLIKDNHIAHIPPDDLPRALHEVVEGARGLDPRPAFVEVEVDTLEQLRAVLATGVDIVLLDNMTPGRLAEAVAMRDQRAPAVQLEASGGVNLRSVRGIAEAGVDRIAVGALTHSASALDIGLDIQKEAHASKGGG